MTDNEIIKALECCLSSNDVIACWKCPAVNFDVCCEGSSKISNGIINEVVDLIHRQNAEIDRLKKRLAIAEDCIWAVEDALYRGSHNDYAENIIEEYDKVIKEME